MDAVANSCSSCSLLQLQAAVLRWPPGRECLGGSGRDGMELWLMEAWSSGEAQAAGQRLGAFLVLVACLVSRRQQCDGLQEATVPTRHHLPRGVLYTCCLSLRLCSRKAYFGNNRGFARPASSSRKFSLCFAVPHLTPSPATGEGQGGATLPQARGPTLLHSAASRRLARPSSLPPGLVLLTAAGRTPLLHYYFFRGCMDCGVKTRVGLYN